MAIECVLEVPLGASLLAPMEAEKVAGGRTYSRQRSGPVRSQADPTKTGGTNLKM